MTTSRALQRILLATALVLVPLGSSAATYHVQHASLDPGENPDPPPPPCQPADSAILDVVIGSGEVRLVVKNSSSQPSSDWIIFAAVIDGQQTAITFPVDLPAGKKGSFLISIRGRFTFVKADVCGNHPGGDVESPTPIVQVTWDDGLLM
jgi:hypothetical protein